MYAFEVNCTQILTMCTDFLRGVRKLCQNRYLHTAKKHIARCAFLYVKEVDLNNYL